MKSSGLKRILTGALIGMAGGLLIWVLSNTVLKPFFFRLEAQTYDWRLKHGIEPPQGKIESVMIVDVDERSVKKMGSYHQWPRTYWARLIQNLSAGGARIIGTDFIFDPNRRYPEEDEAFISAIRNSRRVCSALYFVQADTEHFQPAMAREPEGLNYQRFLVKVPESLKRRLISQERIEPEYPGFINASHDAGFVNLFPDPDGVLRRIPLLLRFNEHVYPAFSLRLAMHGLGADSLAYHEASSRLVLYQRGKELTRIPVDRYGQMIIRYQGWFQTFRYVSFYDVLKGNLPPDFYKDKVVLVGSSLTGLYDLRAIPLQSIFPGVEVNANAVYQIINGQYISRLSEVQHLIWLLILGLISGVLFMMPRPTGTMVLALVLLLLNIMAGFIILNSFSLWWPVATPLFTLLLVFSGTYIDRYLAEERDKKRIRQTFSHYVSASVVEQVLKNPEMLKLGGEKKVCTALFSDVAGFTSISERLTPEQLVALLNEYLTEMTNIVFENRGMLDKYEGDAIMAVFGAPVSFPEHAAAACRCALEMQKRLAALREKWKKENKPELRARIGLNSGEMIAGNMGSQTRFDYTVMGDSVNLASRLEGANKLYGTEIMIGENTFDMVKDEFYTRPLDLLRVKGKKKPVKVYELIAGRDEPLDTRMQELLSQYKQGFDQYLMRNWEWAANHFRQALQIKTDDGPSRLYLLRCQEFMENPPADDWDGVFVMKTK
ncbi:MAG: adenylate/guanylate cyclase domain-containing protein [Calditrichia bacterium]